MMCQADHEGPCGGAVIDEVKLGPPSAKLVFRIAPGRRLVHGAVDGFAEGVHGVHSFPFGLGQEVKRIIKITSTLFREICAKRLSVGSRDGHGQMPLTEMFPVKSTIVSADRFTPPEPTQISAITSRPSMRRGPGRLKYDPAST